MCRRRTSCASCVPGVQRRPGCPGRFTEMGAQLEQPTEEITRLRQCDSDLVSLVALPAIWTGGEPPRIGRTLLEVLLGMLTLDLVYVRLLDSAGEGAFEMVQAGHGRGLPDNAAQTGELLHEWLGPAPGTW